MSGERRKIEEERAKVSVNNTPVTTGGPGGRDRTLAVKRIKNGRNSAFFRYKNTPGTAGGQAAVTEQTLKICFWSKCFACATHGGGCKRSCSFVPDSLPGLC